MSDTVSEHEFAKLAVNRIYRCFYGREENVVIIPEVQRYSFSCGNPGAMDALLIFGEKRNKMVCIEFKNKNHRDLQDQVESTRRFTEIATIGISSEPNHSGYPLIIFLDNFSDIELYSLLKNLSESNYTNNQPTIWLFKYAFGWMKPECINYENLCLSSCHRWSWPEICEMAIINFHKQHGLKSPLDFDILYELFLRCASRRIGAEAIYKKAISRIYRNRALYRSANIRRKDEKNRV
jgi:hypothetical protein